MRQYLNQLYYASAINALWKHDRTYIVKYPTTDCDAENSGPAETCVTGIFDEIALLY